MKGAGIRFWKPTRPFTVIDAINRSAAATGSPRYAMLAADADYNGHHVSVHFNDYRGYWIAEYWWAGRCVLARGSFAEALRAGLREYNRGALGATLVVSPRAESDVRLCLASGLDVHTPEIDAAHHARWWTPLHGEVSQAFRYEQQLGVPAIGFLANAATLEEYKAKVSTELSARRAGGRAA